MAPFTGALALVAGLLLIELVLSFVGASMMADGADGVDVDLGADGVDVDLGADGIDVDAGDLDVLDADAVELEPGTAPGGVADWMGMGQVPFILWLAGLLTAFGLIGYGVQVVSSAVIGSTLPWWAAAALTLLPALKVGGLVSRTLGRLVPKTESSAISRRSMGGRRGVIAQGTARKGKPAQARVRDLYGNMHYVRVEPADEGVSLPQGTEIMILDGRGPIFRAVSLDNNKEGETE